ncbi:MAG: enediyne biosynthesis protein UnbU [Verrucomicrobia bacterium]|nr:enediyne biosynthesis protein UnbU [Verrucomicrobiota bacterium]MBI3870040.1 enediyne biosynthesis protein UnbU [Verrucomicrobiota bacterium]
MKNQAFNATLLFYPKNNPKVRLFALWYFTALMIVWNVLGHTLLGFEQSWATPVVAILTAISVSMLLDWIDASIHNRELRFAGSLGGFLNFLPACLIPGFACGMLLYANERLGPVVFAVVLSIASKLIFRAPVGNGHTQHCFNPSNFGVAATLVLFPDVSFAPPYHFTENLTGVWGWGVPLIVLLTGIVVHGLFTGRLPLVAAWVGGFILQGMIRAKIFGTPLIVPLMPMTSAAFIVFTLYMIPDPATTPLKPSRQALFGFSVAMVYGVLQMLHLVFGLFFALLGVCAIRGVSLHVSAWIERLRSAPVGVKVERTAAAR